MASFRNLLLLYGLWLASGISSGGLFEVYFFNLGLDQAQILLANSLWFIAPLLLIPLFKKIEIKKFMTIGICTSLLGVILLYLFPYTSLAYVFRTLAGIPIFFFWIPFNIIYYEFRKENSAFLGAIYFSMGPIISLVLPFISGWIASVLGFGSLFILSMILYILTLICLKFIHEVPSEEYDFLNTINSISGLRSIIFIEGFAVAVLTSVVLEVMLLNFITNPLDFGAFTSLVTIFSVFATLIMAKISDKQKNRRIFLLPSAIAIGIFTIFTAQSKNIEMFFLGFSLINFFSRIFYPLPLAILADNTKKLHDSMIGREFFLNLGRACGAFFSYVLFQMSSFETLLFVLGVMMLLYVPVFENRKKKLIHL